MNPRNAGATCAALTNRNNPIRISPPEARVAEALLSHCFLPARQSEIAIPSQQGRQALIKRSSTDVALNSAFSGMIEIGQYSTERGIS